MTSYSFNSSLPATVSQPLINWEQEQKQTSLDALHFLVTLQLGPKETAWVKPFTNKKMFSLSLSSDSYRIHKHCFLVEETINPSESFCHQSSLMHPKHKLRMQCVHFTFTRSDKGFRYTLIYKIRHKNDSSLFSSLGSRSVFYTHFSIGPSKSLKKSFKQWIKPPTFDESYNFFFFFL